MLVLYSDTLLKSLISHNVFFFSKFHRISMFMITLSMSKNSFTSLFPLFPYCNGWELQYHVEQSAERTSFPSSQSGGTEPSFLKEAVNKLYDNELNF